MKPPETATFDQPTAAGRRAVELFDAGYLCAESVLVAVAEAYDEKSPLLPRLATGLCSGFSRTGNMCGALTGAAMGIGLVHGRDDPADPLDPCYDRTKSLTDRFRRAHGAVTCLELTGCYLGAEASMARFRTQGLVTTLCRELVRDAAGWAVETCALD